MIPVQIYECTWRREECPLHFHSGIIEIDCNPCGIQRNLLESIRDLLKFTEINWKSQKSFEIHWNALESIEVRWNPLKVIGIHRKPLESIGIHWSQLKSIERHRNPFKIIGIRWNQMEIIGIHWNPFIQWDLLESTEINLEPTGTNNWKTFKTIEIYIYWLCI